MDHTIVVVKFLLNLHMEYMAIQKFHSSHIYPISILHSRAARFLAPRSHLHLRVQKVAFLLPSPHIVVQWL